MYAYKQESFNLTTINGTLRNQFWLPTNSVISVSDSIFDNHSIDKINISKVMKTNYPCYYRSHIFRQPGINWYDQVSVRQNFPYTADCKVHKGTANCTIVNGGIFDFAFPDKFSTGDYKAISYLSEPVTVHQFGYEVVESTRVSLHEANIDKYDVILFPSSGNITNLDPICTIRFSCDFNLAFRILMPVTIFIVSLAMLTLSLFCIHRI